MKKNTMMRLASFLLVAVLLTTCAISGTFAKYVTKTYQEDEARVAYWGFNQAAVDVDINLFDDVYSTTVDSENGDNVVAPGTAKTATFAFAYDAKTSDKNALNAGAIAAPEVEYTFVVDPTITGDYDALDANENFKWTLAAPDEDAAVEYDTVDELLAAVKALSGDVSGTKVYSPGELPEAFTAADQVYTIGWYWTYTVDDDGDVADTAMGNAQDLEDVTFTISISATQND